MFDNKLIAKSFMWMFIGLLVTFITGYVICLNKEALALTLSGFYIMKKNIFPLSFNKTQQAKALIS